MADSDTSASNMENRIREFAQNHGLSFGEAMEMLCGLGLAVCEAVGAELPREVVASLSSYSQPAAQQAAEGEQPAGRSREPQPVGADRRSHPRKPASFMARGKFQNAANVWEDIRGQVTNVSMRGLKLKLDHNTAIEPRAVVTLNMPQMGVETKGKVRHVGRDADGDTILDVGVELTNMSREHWLRWLELLAR